MIFGRPLRTIHLLLLTAAAVSPLLCPIAAAAQEDVTAASVMANYIELTAIGSSDCPPADGDEIVVCAKSNKHLYRISRDAPKEEDRIAGSRADNVGSSALCASRNGASQGIGCGRGLDLVKIIGAIK